MSTLMSAVVLCAALIFTPNTSKAASNPKYAALVMDADTGLILHQRYADKRLHPASLTKVMTLLLLFDAIEDGRVRLNDRIRVSRRASSMQPSKLGLKSGETIRVKDAIYSLVTKSANDVAVAVAEHLAGSEGKFAEAMTSRAREIGMSRTTFKNASGLHNRYQISTARDIAKMARYIIKVYPTYYDYFSRRSFTYKGKTYRNHNRLLGKYEGMDGMKTGYIRASGFNLVASAKRDGQRIIGVVFGGRSSQTRNAHMKTLLDGGFKKSKKIRVASLTAPLPPKKPNALVLASARAHNVPIPPRPTHRKAVKPFENTQLAALEPSAPGTVINTNSSVFRGDQKFNTLIAQGDADPELSQRVSAGLMAISAHTGGQNIAKPMFANYFVNDKDWSIQVGAFKGKDQTNEAINLSLAHLPVNYRAATPVISPLKTRSGWLFRARLKGYSRAEAFEACSYLNDCMPLAP
ncbi:MAG: D-alanyl-D-alanine carboxypeptidase family protein [Pseudomonadota bacterium]